MKIKLFVVMLSVIFIVALSSCGNGIKKDAKALGEKYCKMVELEKTLESAKTDEEKEKIEADLKKIDEEGQKMSDELEKKYSDEKQKKEFEDAFKAETEKCKK